MEINNIYIKGKKEKKIVNTLQNVFTTNIGLFLSAQIDFIRRLHLWIGAVTCCDLCLIVCSTFQLLVPWEHQE